MKRFYCTECKKVKRVRVYPASVGNSQYATKPEDRVGQCTRHLSESYNRTIRNKVSA